MPDVDPVGGIAAAFVDGLVKVGAVNALLEFGAAWTGIATLILADGKGQPTEIALFCVGLIFIAVGGVPLAYRILRHVR